MVQIRTHAQKYFQKLAKEQGTDAVTGDGAATVSMATVGEDEKRRQRPKKSRQAPSSSGSARSSKKHRPLYGADDVAKPHLLIRHRYAPCRRLPTVDAFVHRVVFACVVLCRSYTGRSEHAIASGACLRSTAAVLALLATCSPLTLFLLCVPPPHAHP